MSEIDDLEAYETVPTSIYSSAEAAARKHCRAALPKIVESSERSRRRMQFYAASSRHQQPSLPKFKCLEE